MRLYEKHGASKMADIACRAMLRTLQFRISRRTRFARASMHVHRIVAFAADVSTLMQCLIAFVDVINRLSFPASSLGTCDLR